MLTYNLFDLSHLSTCSNSIFISFYDTAICREASETPCAYVKITPAHLRPVCRDDSWIVFWYSEYF